MTQLLYFDHTPLLKHCTDLFDEGSPSPNLSVDAYMSVIKQVIHVAQASVSR